MAKVSFVIWVYVAVDLLQREKNTNHFTQGGTLAGRGSGSEQAHVPKQIQEGRKQEASNAHDIGALNMGMSDYTEEW